MINPNKLGGGSWPYSASQVMLVGVSGENGGTPATGYSFDGPVGGPVGSASTDFTVALTPEGGEVTGTVTITPSSGGGGGSFTPSTVGLTTASPSATFTYTPASAGTKTISVTNNGGLTDPGSLSYTATTALVDGNSVSTWLDSSGNGHHATQTGTARPIFKTNIVNGLPVVRCTTAASTIMNLAGSISGDWQWTIFAVMKPAGGTLFTLLGNDSFKPQGPIPNATGVGIGDRKFKAAFSVAFTDFHVVTAGAVSNVTAPVLFIDGGNVAVGSNPDATNTGNFVTITGGDGDIAEVLIYNTLIGGTDRLNLQTTLGTKYAITVVGGGSVIDPTTVSGLVGWWKADSLG